MNKIRIYGTYDSYLWELCFFRWELRFFRWELRFFRWELRFFRWEIEIFLWEIASISMKMLSVGYQNGITAPIVIKKFFFVIFLPHLQHTIHNGLRNRMIYTCCKSKTISFICHTFVTQLLKHKVNN